MVCGGASDGGAAAALDLQCRRVCMACCGRLRQCEMASQLVQAPGHLPPPFPQVAAVEVRAVGTVMWAGGAAGAHASPAWVQPRCLRRLQQSCAFESLAGAWVECWKRNCLRRGEGAVGLRPVRRRHPGRPVAGGV